MAKITGGGAASFYDATDVPPVEHLVHNLEHGYTVGAMQYCGAVSGEAVIDFVRAHPASDAPEPNGA